MSNKLLYDFENLWFDRPSVLNYLDPKTMLSAESGFDWCNSPQGPNYWANLKKHTEVSKKYLQDVITQYDNKNPVRCTKETSEVGDWVICLKGSASYTAGKAYRVKRNDNLLFTEKDDKGCTTNGKGHGFFRPANPWEIPVQEDIICTTGNTDVGEWVICIDGVPGSGYTRGNSYRVRSNTKMWLHTFKDDSGDPDNGFHHYKFRKAHPHETPKESLEIAKTPMDKPEKSPVIEETNLNLEKTMAVSANTNKNGVVNTLTNSHGTLFQYSDFSQKLVRPDGSERPISLDLNKDENPCYAIVEGFTQSKTKKLANWGCRLALSGLKYCTYVPFKYLAIDPAWGITKFCATKARYVLFLSAVGYGVAKFTAPEIADNLEEFVINFVKSVV